MDLPRALDAGSQAGAERVQASPQAGLTVVRGGALVACAILIAGVLEPAWEYYLGGATWEWAFGRVRLAALTAFVATGIAAHVTTVALLRRADRPGGAA